MSIDKHDIEVEDFSISMGEVIAKVRSLATLCTHNDEEVMTFDLMSGLGHILQEISDDLVEMYEVFYPGSKEPVCPGREGVKRYG